VLRSSDGGQTSQQWGENGYVPVPGDYDGDGRTDYAVWQPSSATWFVIRSRDGGQISQQWGQDGDMPVPGDYDGDGKTDYAIWRPSSATWWVIGSRDGREVNQHGVKTEIYLCPAITTAMGERTTRSGGQAAQLGS
jgi:hypothetical protein